MHKQSPILTPCGVDDWYYMTETMDEDDCFDYWLCKDQTVSYWPTLLSDINRKACIRVHGTDTKQEIPESQRWLRAWAHHDFGWSRTAEVMGGHLRMPAYENWLKSFGAGLVYVD